MGTSVGSIGFDLRGYTDEVLADVRKGMRSVSKELERHGKKIDAIGRRMSAALTAPILALGAVAVKAAATQQKAEARVQAALERTGQEVENNLARYKQFAAELQQNSVYGDEVTLGLMATGTAMGATADQAVTLAQASADMAAAMDKDIGEVGSQLIKTLGGFAGELGEVIPELKNLTTEQLRAGAALDLVRDKFAGFAAAEAQTFEGRMKQAKNAVGDLFEVLGMRLLPKVTQFAEKLRDVATGLQNVNPQTLDLAIKMAGVLAIAGPLAIGVGLVTKAVAGLATVSLVGVVSSFALLVTVGGAAAAVMHDADLKAGSMKGSMKSLSSVIGKAMEIVAKAMHGVRIGLNVLAVGVLQFGQYMARFADGTVRSFQLAEVWVTRFANGFIKAFNDVTSFYDRHIVPMYAGLRAGAAISGLPGMSLLPKSIPTAGGAMALLPEPKVTGSAWAQGFAQGLEEEMAGRADRTAELMNNWPGKFEATWDETTESVSEHMSNLIDKSEMTAEQIAAAMAGAGDAVKNSVGGGAAAAGRSIEDMASKAQIVGQQFQEGVGRHMEAFADRAATFLTSAEGSFKSFGEVVQSVLGDIAHEMARSGILQLLGVPGGGSAGGGSLFSGSGLFGAIGSFFGGFFGDGGDPPVGKMSIVGEAGPEAIVPKRASTVIPLGGVGGASQQVVVHQHFQSGLTKAELAGMLDEAEARGANRSLEMMQQGGGFRDEFLRTT